MKQCQCIENDEENRSRQWADSFIERSMHQKNKKEINGRKSCDIELVIVMKTGRRCKNEETKLFSYCVHPRATSSEDHLSFIARISPSILSPSYRAVFCWFCIIWQCSEPMGHPGWDPSTASISTAALWKWSVRETSYPSVCRGRFPLYR